MQDLIPANQAESPRPATSLNDGEGSLLSMFPAAVLKVIKLAMENHPHLFDVHEKDLFKLLRQEQAHPSPTDNCLRYRFWAEYDRARGRGEKKVNLSNIYSGVCYEEFFFKRYLPNPLKVSWMLCIPLGYSSRALETLEFGITRMREILEMDPVIHGKLSVPLLTLQAKITEMMNTWVKGAPVQRTLAVNVNTNRQVTGMSVENSMEDLEKKLRALEQRNKIAKNLPDIDMAEIHAE